MDKLTSFLDKYKNFEPADLVIKNKLISLIKEEVGLIIEKKQIELRSPIIYLKINPIIKTEVLLYEKKILQKLGSNYYSKIR